MFVVQLSIITLILEMLARQLFLIFCIEFLLGRGCNTMDFLYMASMPYLGTHVGHVGFLIHWFSHTWLGHAQIGHGIFNTWVCTAWPASCRALFAALVKI